MAKRSTAPVTETEITPVDYAAQFEAQRHLAKKEVYKLQPGSWLIVKWKDAPNSIHMLLSKPERCNGDVSLDVWNPVVPYGRRSAYNSTSVCHDQVVGVHCVTEQPEFTPGA